MERGRSARSAASQQENVEDGPIPFFGDSGRNDSTTDFFNSAPSTYGGNQASISNRSGNDDDFFQSMGLPSSSNRSTYPSTSVNPHDASGGSSLMNRKQPARTSHHQQQNFPRPTTSSHSSEGAQATLDVTSLFGGSSGKAADPGADLFSTAVSPKISPISPPTKKLPVTGVTNPYSAARLARANRSRETTLDAAASLFSAPPPVSRNSSSTNMGSADNFFDAFGLSDTTQKTPPPPASAAKSSRVLDVLGFAKPVEAEKPSVTRAKVDTPQKRPDVNIVAEVAFPPQKPLPYKQITEELTPPTPSQREPTVRISEPKVPTSLEHRKPVDQVVSESKAPTVFAAQKALVPGTTSTTIPKTNYSADLGVSTFNSQTTSPAIVDFIVEHTIEEASYAKSPKSDDHTPVANPFATTSDFNVADEVTFASNTEDLGMVPQKGTEPLSKKEVEAAPAETTPVAAIEAKEIKPVENGMALKDFEDIDTNPRKYGLFSRTIETDSAPAPVSFATPTPAVDDLDDLVFGSKTVSGIDGGFETFPFDGMESKSDKTFDSIGGQPATSLQPQATELSATVMEEHASDEGVLRPSMPVTGASSFIATDEITAGFDLSGPTNNSFSTTEFQPDGAYDSTVPFEFGPSDNNFDWSQLGGAENSTVFGAVGGSESNDVFANDGMSNGLVHQPSVIESETVSESHVFNETSGDLFTSDPASNYIDPSSVHVDATAYPYWNSATNAYEPDAYGYSQPNIEGAVEHSMEYGYNSQPVDLSYGESLPDEGKQNGFDEIQSFPEAAVSDLNYAGVQETLHANDQGYNQNYDHFLTNTEASGQSLYGGSEQPISSGVTAETAYDYTYNGSTEAVFGSTQNAEVSTEFAPVSHVPQQGAFPHTINADENLNAGVLGNPDLGAVVNEAEKDSFPQFEADKNFDDGVLGNVNTAGAVDASAQIATYDNSNYHGDGNASWDEAVGGACAPQSFDLNGGAQANDHFDDQATNQQVTEPTFETSGNYGSYSVESSSVPTSTGGFAGGASGIPPPPPSGAGYDYSVYANRSTKADYAGYDSSASAAVHSGNGYAGYNPSTIGEYAEYDASTTATVNGEYAGYDPSVNVATTGEYAEYGTSTNAASTGEYADYQHGSSGDYAGYNNNGYAGYPQYADNSQYSREELSAYGAVDSSTAMPATSSALDISAPAHVAPLDGPYFNESHGYSVEGSSSEYASLTTAVEQPNAEAQYGLELNETPPGVNGVQVDHYQSQFGSDVPLATTMPQTGQNAAPPEAYTSQHGSDIPMSTTTSQTGQAPPRHPSQHESGISMATTLSQSSQSRADAYHAKPPIVPTQHHNPEFGRTPSSHGRTDMGYSTYNSSPIPPHPHIKMFPAEARRVSEVHSEADRYSSYSASSNPAQDWILCSSCHKKIDQDSFFCNKCGAKVVKQFVETPPPPPASNTFVTPIVEDAGPPQFSAQMGIPPPPQGGNYFAEQRSMGDVSQQQWNANTSMMPQQAAQQSYGGMHRFSSPDLRSSQPVAKSMYEVDDPLGRQRGGAIATWGLGGKLVVTKPRRLQRLVTNPSGVSSMYEKSFAGSMSIMSVQNLLADRDLLDNVPRFPGPLLGAKTKLKKKDVVKLCEDGIKEAEGKLAEITSWLASGDAKNVELRYKRLNAEDNLMLWRLVKLYVENDGSFNASFKKDELPKLKEQFPSVKNSEAHSTVHEIASCLLHGDRARAFRTAINAELFSHALIISAQIDKDAYKEAASKFIASELIPREKTFPSSSVSDIASLRVLYSLYGGCGRHAINEFLPDQLATSEEYVLGVIENWKETLFMILTNRTPGDQAAIAELGDFLRARGQILASQICYLLSPGNSSISGEDTEGVRVVLLGVDAKEASQNLSSRFSALHLTEIFEFGQTLANGMGAAGGLPHLQGYKLAYAWWLADHGFIDLAVRYCDSIEHVVKSYAKGSHYFHRTFVEVLRDLCERLATAQSKVTTESKDNGSWFGKVARFDSLVSAFDRGINRLMIGAIGDDPNSLPDSKKQASSHSMTRTSSTPNQSVQLDNNGGGNFSSAEVPSFPTMTRPSSTPAAVLSNSIPHMAKTSSLSYSDRNSSYNNVANADYGAGGSEGHQYDENGYSTTGYPSTTDLAASSSNMYSGYSGDVGGSGYDHTYGQYGNNGGYGGSHGYAESYGNAGYSADGVYSSADGYGSTEGYGTSEGLYPSYNGGLVEQGANESIYASTDQVSTQLLDAGYSNSYGDYGGNRDYGHQEVSTERDDHKRPPSFSNPADIAPPTNGWNSESSFGNYGNSISDLSYTDNAIASSSANVAGAQEGSGNRSASVNHIGDDDDDLGLGNVSLKKKKAEDIGTAGASESKDASVPEKKEGGTPTSARSSGIFSFIPTIPFFGGSKKPDDKGAAKGEAKPTKADLGQKLSLVYDPVLKKYVNPKTGGAPADEAAKALPPPPMSTSWSAPASRLTSPSPAPKPPQDGPGRPSSAAPATDRSSSQPGSTSASPLAGAGPSFGTVGAGRTGLGPASRRGARNRYVDVMNPDAAKGGESPAIKSFLPPSVSNSQLTGQPKMMMPQAPMSHASSFADSRESVSSVRSYGDVGSTEYLQTQTSSRRSSAGSRPLGGGGGGQGLPPDL
ncbi:vesicle coat component [Dinochytrium kinnereticum]|nr:vesicle coat component [Dinochytrium kinnereticum]